jgi:hypothetical protein
LLFGAKVTADCDIAANVDMYASVDFGLVQKTSIKTYQHSEWQDSEDLETTANWINCSLGIQYPFVLSSHTTLELSLGPDVLYQYGYSGDVGMDDYVAYGIQGNLGLSFKASRSIDVVANCMVVYNPFITNSSLVDKNNFFSHAVLWYLRQ